MTLNFRSSCLHFWRGIKHATLPSFCGVGEKSHGRQALGQLSDIPVKLQTRIIQTSQSENWVWDTGGNGSSPGGSNTQAQKHSNSCCEVTWWQEAGERKLQTLASLSLQQTVATQPETGWSEPVNKGSRTAAGDNTVRCGGRQTCMVAQTYVNCNKIKNSISQSS